MTKRALLIGINDYAPVGVGEPDLRGCVNDVRDMAHTLNVLGGISRRRLDSLVSADLAKNGFAQVPQLEGTKTALNQKPFT